MAVKIGDVTIRIGANTSQLEYSLRKAERALQASSQKFQQLGQSMTLGLTAPILGIGAAAVTSFGEIERLQNALTAVMGDAGAAAEEFERLREVAEAPGLALPQVVSASAKLQAVGLTAEEARKTIAEYGNAVARSGGQAQEFDGAILALTQIASKGKISAEELNQLGERIFEIRPALEAAFGTSNSEELQKLGISAEEFIAKTTSELAKLERVQGGLSNSFENFRDSSQAAFASLGESISEAINLPKLLSSISDSLAQVTEFFKNLSPAAKQTVITIAALTAVAGPLVSVYSKVISIFGAVQIAIVKKIATLQAEAAAQVAAAAAEDKKTASTVAGNAANAINTASTAAATAATNIQTAATNVGAAASKSAAAAQVTFGTALKATLLVAAPYVAIIGLIAGGIYLLYKNYQSTNQVAESLNNVQRESAESMAAEKAQADRLIKVINDETKSKQDKKKALNELIAISPEYFKGLTIEKDDIKKINEQYTSYISNLKAASLARAAESKQDKLSLDVINQETELRQLRAKLAKEESDAIAESARSGASLERQGINYAATAAQNTQREINARILKLGYLNAEREALSDIINKNKQIVTSDPTPDTGGGGGKVDPQLQKELAKIQEELSNLDKLFAAGLIAPTDLANERITLLTKKLELLVTNGFSPTSEAVKNLKTEITGLRSAPALEILPQAAGIQSLETVVSGLQQRITGGVTTASAAVNSILKNTSTTVRDYYVGIGAGFVDAQGKFKAFAKEVSAVSIDIGQQLSQAFGSSLEAVGVLIGNLLSGEGAGSLKTFFNSILTVIIDFAIGLGKQLIALGTATEALQKLFTAGGGVGAVIAGIGLIAVATIVKGIISKGVPSLAIGTDLVKSDGLAMLHAGEKVVPADVVKGGYTGGNGIAQVAGRIQGTDIILVSDYAMNFKNRIR